jgi:cold shock CspA family protein/ribosome-associated translation inhibitor RaiA
MDLEISAQHTEVHPRWRQIIDRQLTKLNGKGAPLLRLHVTLVHSTHHIRGHEEVRLLATMPGRALRVQKSRANIGDAIRAAFLALTKEIDADAAQRRSPSRSYGPHFTGTISQLFGDRGYGFIRTLEAQEIYFHRDALHHLTFTELREGQEVQFDVEQGDKGPQASRVYPAAE